MARIELDTVYLEDLGTDVLEPVTALSGATASISRLNGPAGGWPVVAWEGTEAQLSAVLDWYSDNDPEDREQLRELYGL
jgi:hypothetical protein